jgi:hypothetical protein
MQGRYIFKSNGVVIAESKNILTTNGRDIINQYLAGLTTEWAGSMAVGSLYSSATINDTQLSYEVIRQPITTKSYITTSGSNQLVIKSTFPAPLVMSIYEIGIIPQNLLNTDMGDNFFITDFSETYGSTASSSWQVGSSASTASYTPLSSTLISRSGSYNLTIPTGSIGISNFNSILDISNFTTNDYLNLLYYIPASATGTTSVKFILTDTNGLIWTSSTTALNVSSSGYFSASFSLNGVQTSGFNNSLATVTASVFGTSTASPSFDMLKIQSSLPKSSLQNLVSRSSSSAAIITTTFGQPLEIEYYLTVN